jgi:Family of unknown function (DUF6364)
VTRNITLAIDDNDLSRARRYAAEHATTVNALVREYLKSLSPELTEEQLAAVERMRARSDARSSFMSGRTGTRADIYDRKIMAWR